MTASDNRKLRQLQAHGEKESTFLRLKRTKLGLDDFRTVKVIGKGAFGEVIQFLPSLPHTLTLVSTGPPCAEGGYWQDLRHEDIDEERNVETRPSGFIASSIRACRC